jgi:hypothetical protein
MMRDKLAGLALFFGHVRGLANPLQFPQFGLVESRENVPIGWAAGVAAVSHQNFQTEITAEGNEAPVSPATPPDPRSYNEQKCQ